MFLFQTINNYLICAFFLVLSYFIGSLPFGVIFGKIFKHIDIREHGSHNIGTTNSIRILGLKLGIPVFIFEVLKGAIVILLVKYVFDGLIFDNPIPFIFYGFTAALGHLFPIYIKFKGGKIVAPSLGIVLALSPIPGIACLIVFLITLVIIGYVSISSCSAAITVITVMWIQYAFGYTGDNQWLEYIFGKPELITPIIYSILMVVIFIRHIGNFKRLIHGTENKAKFKQRMIAKRAKKNNSL